jgi:death-on-curing protein
MATAYTAGIVQNHPFVDGNKRTGFAAMIVFLGLNGVDFNAPPEAATAVVLSLAAGEINEDQLARWIADNLGSSSG